MKKVLILFGKSRWDKSKPFSNKKYRCSYEYFYTLCKKNNIQMYRASYQWYDYKKRIFKYAWIFEETGSKWRRAYNIKPDLIFDKTKATPEAYLKKSLIRDDYQFFNNNEFTKIIDNKLNIGIIFPEWSKKSVVVKNNDHLNFLFRKLSKSKRVVLKPINLSGGKNVLIGNKKEIIEKIKELNVTITDWILQDFIDSSAGILQIMVGVHDLRVVVINGKISYSYYRKPSQGSLLANLAQGGTMEIIDSKIIPENVFPIIKKAREIFSGFSCHIYTIDLMFDKNKKPWIVELNSMPGMYFAPGQEKTRKIFYTHLLNTFKKILALN